MLLNIIEAQNIALKTKMLMQDTTNMISDL